MRKENPILKDPSQLKSYSSSKTWKRNHKIKKKVNKRNIRKGIYT